MLCIPFANLHTIFKKNRINYAWKLGKIGIWSPLCKSETRQTLMKKKKREKITETDSEKISTVIENCLQKETITLDAVIFS